jgi:hypothetical protein
VARDKMSSNLSCRPKLMDYSNVRRPQILREAVEASCKSLTCDYCGKSDRIDVVHCVECKSDYCSSGRCEKYHDASHPYRKVE